MDDLDNFNFSPDESLGDSISFDESDIDNTSISHSPLDLGNTTGTPQPKAKPISEPAAPVTKAPPVMPASGEKITKVRTFFTKLHAGALTFLDEQINDWLKKNPEIRIKRTNTVTGEVQGKKSEPNIIVTVWY